MNTTTLSPEEAAVLQEAVRYLGGTNHNLVGRIESPNGQSVATLVSFMTNCMVVGLHRSGDHPMGPWVNVEQVSWSPDSKHLAFVATFLSDPEEEYEPPAYCVYIDGHKVASYAQAPNDLEFSDDSRTLIVTVNGNLDTLQLAA